MDDEFRYEDFDLLIEPGPRGKYRARVLRSPAGDTTYVQFTVPSDLELENFVLRVGRPRSGTRGPGRPESAPLKTFGGKLYAAVFQDSVRDMLQGSISKTRAQGVGLRLRLRLADTPELAELPWEFLYDPRLDRFLAQSRHTPLVRYLDLPDPPRPLSVQGALRLLVMISSPVGYPELDVEQEWSLLTGALAKAEEAGAVIVERLPATMSALRSRLRQEEFHVFHFVGHGLYRPDWGDGVLVMEDRHGHPHEVPGDELGGLLCEYDTTRLAVLNACEGARSDTSDPFAGMAQSLIQQGLPAVVAMQFEITDEAAIVFAHELYGAIADGYPLEAALSEARGAIRDQGHITEWGTPVLYSRAPDGRLFDLTGQTRIPAAERKAREEAERQAREEAERQARAEAERKARAEADRQARAEADRQAREEAERKAREEAERKAREEAERQTQAEAERKAREEAERMARAEAGRQAREEADRRAQAEAERKAQAEAERKAWEEAERKAQPEAGRKTRGKADRKAREGTGRKTRGKADPKAGEETGPKAKAETGRKAGGRAGPKFWQGSKLTGQEKDARAIGQAGDAAGARDRLATLLPIRERLSGAEHPDTLATRSSLAYWTGQAGDAAGARDQYSALLPIRERVLGADHPDTLTTSHDLAYWTRESRS